MDFISEYGLFLLKAATGVFAFLAVVAIAKFASDGTSQKGSLKVRSLNEEYDENVEELESYILSQPEQKALKKSRKSEGEAVTEGSRRAQTFVLDFKGGIDAKEVVSLREEITSVLAVAKEGDEVFLRLETGGGLVSSYGLAAAQLQRIKTAGIKLVISVDKIAASGGYMMACVADHIVAAPFATIGSIGVIAQIPNFNKLLKKNDVEFEMHTAGDFKRTLTMFGENTDAARQKFKTELDETHELFIDHVDGHRPQLVDFDFATGECWYGSKAKEYGLVDEVGTSDDYIVSAMKTRNVLHVSYQLKKSLSQKLSKGGASVAEAVFMKLAEKNARPMM